MFGFIIEPIAVNSYGSVIEWVIHFPWGKQYVKVIGMERATGEAIFAEICLN